MRIPEIPINRGLEKLAGGICNLNNKYLFKLSSEELNPRSPIRNYDEWEKNMSTGLTYASFGLGNLLASIPSAIGICKQTIYMIKDIGNISKNIEDFGFGLIYLSVFGLSINLAKKSGEIVKTLQEKREIRGSYKG
jgi:hypothetical protein